MRLSRSKRGVLLLASLLLVGLFVVRPGADRLRWRIVRSISLAVGRPVQVGYVSLRFLPPGFELDKFSVHDDPAFSAEPILRSEQVTASLRVISLLRGRLEISRLELTEPSLNLVRNAEGHWNVESILERAAQTPVAPTGKARSERRPGFPYIEAERGRINFKIGQEKKPHALTEADFSVWQESEDSWGMRLKAKPVRTDFNITDTGILRADGRWKRASSLRETPLQFSMEWNQGQLGQLTKLLTGSDKGWRGTLTLDSTLEGTPAALKFKSKASVDDFRRYDLLSDNALRLVTQCQGTYSTVDRSVTDAACTAPVGDGSVSADGAVQHIFSSPTYNISLRLKDLPASSLAGLARHIKKNLPDDLTAEGKVNASFSFKRIADVSVWSGEGAAEEVKLSSPSGNSEITIRELPFALAEQIPSRRHSHEALGSAARLMLGTFDVTVGPGQTLTARGWASRTAYSLSIAGDAQVQHLLQLAQVTGIPVLHPTADGQAKVDLTVAGDWTGFAPPLATGDAQLHAVRAEVRGVNAPLQIASANLALLPDQIRVQNLTASLGTSTWKGSVQMPRGCNSPRACLVQFDLRSDSVVSNELAELFDPRKAKRPWYRLLSVSAPANPYLKTLHAEGKLSANRVTFRNVIANRVAAAVALENGKLRVSDLRGDVLGGSHVGEWTADFTSRPPAYYGSGILQHASMEQLAATMHDGWVTGKGTASYEVTATGVELSQLTTSASGKLRIEVEEGTFPHIELASGNGPLRVHRLAASFRLREGVFEVEQGKLETPGGIFQLSGTASLAQALNVKLVHDANQAYMITGTLPEPKVVPALHSEARAALKQ